MAIREEIILDLLKPMQLINIRLQQNDGFERKVDVLLTSNGDLYNIPSTATVTLRMQKRDGSPIYNKCELINNNKVSFKITPQMTSLSGRQPAQLQIIDNATGGILKTLRFHLLIDEEVITDSMIIDSGEFTALEDAMLRIGDLSLTEEVRELNEVKRIQAEQDRENRFETEKNALINQKSQEIDTQFSEKYDGLEQEYAQDLTTVKSQLQQIENETVKKNELTNDKRPKGNSLYTALPTTGNQEGDYYYCTDGDGINPSGNYVWNGSSWYFGGTGDEGYSKLKDSLISNYANMNLFIVGGLVSSNGSIDTTKITHRTSKILRVKHGESIKAPKGFKIRVASYSGNFDAINDTAQYFNGITSWADTYTYDASANIYTLKRIEIYKYGQSDLTLDTLQGHVNTTISNLLALENVKFIRMMAEQIDNNVEVLNQKVDNIIDSCEKISIYNAFDLSDIKHGYENGNIALMAKKGETHKVRLLGNKTGDWSVSFELDALYRYEVDTKISIRVTDGTNTLTLTQTDSTADTYKKYFYMIVDYNGITKASLHLLTAKKKITRKDGVLYLELGDYEEVITLGEFGTAEVTVTIEAVESAENVYYVKNFESTLSGFTIPTYNLYIRDIDFAEDDDYIYLVYYVNAIAQLSKMNKLTGSYETVTLTGMRADIDSHNSIAIELDNSGNLHIAGGCHASALVYFTGSASDISSVAKSSALSEAYATYPEFVSDGTNLYFVCRSGTSGSSYDIAYKYTSGAWTRTTSVYIDDGTNGNGGTCYFSPWELCGDGYFYSAFCWRNNDTGVSGVGANMRVCAVKTNNFQNFYDLEGNLLTLPMTIGNTESCIVDDVAQNMGLLNQVGMGVMDADGKPIVWYYKNDEYGNRNLYFASRKNSNWNIVRATNCIGKAIMQGAGTIDSLISRMKFAYRSDYGNAVIYAKDAFGRNYVVELDSNCQSFYKDIELPEYKSGNEQICISRKHGSAIVHKTQRTLFDRNLPQKGNGMLTVFC